MVKDFEIGDAVFNRVRNKNGVVIGITFEEDEGEVAGFGDQFYLISYGHEICKEKQGDLEFIKVV